MSVAVVLAAPRRRGRSTARSSSSIRGANRARLRHQGFRGRIARGIAGGIERYLQRRG